MNHAKSQLCGLLTPQISKASKGKPHMLYIPYPFKRCVSCGEDYPATTHYFTRHKTASGGLSPKCKPCKQAANRKWWADNTDSISQRRKVSYPQRRDSVLARSQKWREANREYDLQKKKKYYWNNRERDLAKSRAWREANREYKRQYDREYARKRSAKIKVYKEQWRQKNIEHVKEHRRQQYKLNPTSRRVSEYRRDARKRGLPDTFTNDDWLIALDYWHDCCAYCGSQQGLFEWTKLTADHFIPLNLSDCPGTVPENMIPACKSCNCSKQDNEPRQWLAERFGKTKGKQKAAQVLQFFEWIKIRRK